MTETWDEYAARVHSDYMDKPEKYYKTGVISRNNAELEESRQRELMAEHEFARKYGQLEQTQ